jgi:hypothetical protein
MTDTLLEDLSRIDPLPATVDPPPVAGLLKRLDPTIRPLREPLSRPRGRWRPTRARMGVAAAALTAASVATALALSGLGGGRLNVAAAAYRATAAGPGVLHMSIVTERTVGSATTTTSEQIWTAQDPRRMRTVQTDSEETREGALTTTPARSLVWSSSQPTVIKESTPANVDLTESSPVQTIHRLLGEGRATVLGKTTYEGRDAWQLQVHPQTPPASFNGTRVPEPELIVAAQTYIPLALVEHFAASENGKPELAEQRTRYTTYEELPTNPQDEAMVDLAPHAGATVRREG